MSDELPEPVSGLPHGTTDDDVRKLWAEDCPACEGRGWTTVRDRKHKEKVTCANCGGTGHVEIPY